MHANRIADRRRRGRNAIQWQAEIHHLEFEVFPRRGKQGWATNNRERYWDNMRTSAYSNGDCCSVIRVGYDSHTNMIACINPAAIFHFGIKLGFCDLIVLWRHAWRSLKVNALDYAL